MSKHVQEVLVDGQWKDEPVFIIGGGPSAKAFPMELLKDCKVIGCNQAWKMSVVDIVVILDKRVVDLARKTPGWDSFQGLRLMSLKNMDYSYGELSWLPSVKRDWGKSLAEGVISRRCAGIQAVNLACILGSGAIFLIGFDHGGSKGRTHWHDDYKKLGWGPNEAKFRKLGIDWGEVFERNLPNINCPVFNLNPKSYLKVFPRMEPEKGIAMAAAMKEGKKPSLDPKDLVFY